MKQHDQLERKSVTTHHPLRAILLFALTLVFALLPTVTQVNQTNSSLINDTYEIRYI
jgi:hypothetical protein